MNTTLVPATDSSRIPSARGHVHAHETLRNVTRALPNGDSPRHGNATQSASPGAGRDEPWARVDAPTALAQSDGLLDRELDDLLLQIRGLVLVRGILAERGATAAELDAHSAELARLRGQLAHRIAPAA